MPGVGPTKRLGLIGVGEIGLHFARNLVKSGYALTIHDLDSSKVDAAVAIGAEVGGSPGEVTRRSKIVLLSLTDSLSVEEVMAGKDGILGTLRPGQLVVDTGTSRPSADIHWAEACEQRGAGFIDAPVTRRDDRLLMFAGATEENFAEAHDILEAMASKVEHVGVVGQGHRLKLVNQLILLGQMAVHAESVEFARQLGVDPRLIRDVLELNVPEAMFGETFKTAHHISLGYKDLKYIFEVAHEVEAYIPIASFVHEVFKATKRHRPHQVQQAIITYWRRLNEET